MANAPRDEDLGAANRNRLLGDIQKALTNYATLPNSVHADIGSND